MESKYPYISNQKTYLFTQKNRLKIGVHLWSEGKLKYKSFYCVKAIREVQLLAQYVNKISTAC